MTQDNSHLIPNIVGMLLRASMYLQLSGSALQKAIGHSPEDAGRTYTTKAGFL